PDNAPARSLGRPAGRASDRPSGSAGRRSGLDRFRPRTRGASCTRQRTDQRQPAPTAPAAPMPRPVRASDRAGDKSAANRPTAASRRSSQLMNRPVQTGCLSSSGLSDLVRVQYNISMSPRREPGHQEVPQATVVAQFRDYHPEKFFGQGDPRIVDEWVQGLEMIFEVMDCPDHYRVLCAQLQLTGDARLWWNAYWSMRPDEKDGCTWDTCKELIREKYYPTYYRAEMERQFLALKQGSRSVDEYEREFTKLRAF
ncbi:Unknown protein, partial [Striga hermonthica]